MFQICHSPPENKRVFFYRCRILLQKWETTNLVSKSTSHTLHVSARTVHAGNVFMHQPSKRVVVYFINLIHKRSWNSVKPSSWCTFEYYTFLISSTKKVNQSNTSWGSTGPHFKHFKTLISDVAAKNFFQKKFESETVIGTLKTINERVYGAIQ